MSRNAIPRSCFRAFKHQSHHQANATPQISCRQTLISPTRPLPASSASSPRSRLAASTRRHASSPAASTVQAKDIPSQDEAQLEGAKTSDVGETYLAQNKAEILFKECARQADYIVPQAFEKEGEVPKNSDQEDVGEGTGWWYNAGARTPTFNTWFQITAFHMYLLVVRFRYFSGNRAEIWQQHLTNHFFYECEHRMTIYHKVSSRSIRNRYLKDFYNQWRGVLGAYDEGLVKGDAVLATAIWRNIFKGDENVDWRTVAMVTSFARRALRALDGTKDDTVRDAKVKFSNPAGEAAVVEKPSKGISAKFEEADGDAWKGWEKRLQESGARGQ